jgi:hypothetical protein
LIAPPQAREPSHDARLAVAREVAVARGLLLEATDVAAQVGRAARSARRRRQGGMRRLLRGRVDVLRGLPSGGGDVRG